MLHEKLDEAKAEAEAFTHDPSNPDSPKRMSVFEIERADGGLCYVAAPSSKQAEAKWLEANVRRCEIAGKLTKEPKVETPALSDDDYADLI